LTPAPSRPAAPTQFLAAAEKYFEEGDFKRAEDELLHAGDAGEARGQLDYAWARLEQAKQNPVAERTWLDRAIADDPANVSAHLRLAQVLQAAGLWHKAVDEYETVLKIAPDNLFAYTSLASIYAGQSQPRRAAEILAEAIKHAPDDSSLYLRLGDMYAQRNAQAEAEDAYDRAAHMSQGAERADALDRLGDLYVSAQRDHEGFICYEEAAKLRGPGNSTLAEKRYQQIMGAADQALLKSAQQAAQALQSYVSGQGVYREEAFAAMNDFSGQVKEIGKFADGIAPPASLKETHAVRELAYSLADEAATNGVMYLDRGGQAYLDEYRLRLQKALDSLQTLQRPKS
jgi:tetratricopeptide (TPR) repeat protein